MAAYIRGGSKYRVGEPKKAWATLSLLYSTEYIMYSVMDVIPLDTIRCVAVTTQRISIEACRFCTLFCFDTTLTSLSMPQTQADPGIERESELAKGSGAR